MIAGLPYIRQGLVELGSSPSTDRSLFKDVTAKAWPGQASTTTVSQTKQLTAYYKCWKRGLSMLCYTVSYNYNMSYMFKIGGLGLIISQNQLFI